MKNNSKKNNEIVDWIWSKNWSYLNVEKTNEKKVYVLLWNK